MPMEKEQINPEQIADENRQAATVDLGAEDIAARERPADPSADVKEADQDAPKPIVRAGKFDDKRKSIAEKARRIRDGIEESSAEGDPSRNEQRDDQQEPGDQQQQPPVQVQKRKLKVNGRELDLTEEEVVAAAQKALAADDILDKAKKDRAEAHTLLEELRAARRSQPAAAEPQPARTEPDPASMPDDKDLDEIIDKIQVGDPKEAKAALKKYEQRILDRIGNLDEVIETQVTAINERAQRKRETNEMLTAFARDNSEIKNSGALQAALAHQAADTMRAKMFDLGVRPETLNDVKNQLGLNDIQATAAAYRSLQHRGHVLPSHGDILKEAFAEIRKQFGMPERQTTQPPAERQPTNFNTQERQERKRVMTPQPRRANVAPYSAEKQEVDRQEAARRAVQQMQAYRRGRA